MYNLDLFYELNDRISVYFNTFFIFILLELELEILYMIVYCIVLCQDNFIYMLLYLKSCIK